MTARLADVVAALEQLYDPGWAESWDAVGLVCGDPAAAVRRVLFAVDPVAAVADEAVALGVDLLVTHHPLFLRPVHGIAETTAKARLITRLVRAGIGLHVAHTNADVANPGVSDALATALGIHDLRPLAPVAADPLDKLVTFVPHADTDRVVDALAAAGAGAIGDYSRCAWTTPGTGTFLPGVRADPAIGNVGEIETVAESRVEMVLPRARRSAVVGALRTVHPYEEPAYDVFELALPPDSGNRGMGRVGELPAGEPLAAFVQRAVAALPRTAGGLRALGRPDRGVRVVAVSGGAGDSLLGAARRSGADAFLTADLRHHPASEHGEDSDVALVDAPHWATEWPWLLDAASRLASALGGRNLGVADSGWPAPMKRAAPGSGAATVEVAVSALVTDPWTLHSGALPVRGQEPSIRRGDPPMNLRP